MTSTIKTHETFRINVVAASPAAPLAILSLASILGIEPQQAADRLASLPTVLADDVALPVARRLSAMLMAFGFQVRLDPTLSPQPEPDAWVDLSVQAASLPELAPVGPLSARLGIAAEVILAALMMPEGLLLRGLPAAQAEALRMALRRERQLRLIVSDPRTARYDAFAIPRRTMPVQELRRLGLSGCHFSGAVAAGLDAQTARHLGRRTQGSLAIVNRDFLRFDLFLVGSVGLEPNELADFLAVRPATRRAVTPPCGAIAEQRVIDAGLTYSDALQFTADYAQIGLEVVAKVRGLPRSEPANI